MKTTSFSTILKTKVVLSTLAISLLSLQGCGGDDDVNIDIASVIGGVAGPSNVSDSEQNNGSTGASSNQDEAVVVGFPVVELVFVKDQSAYGTVHVELNKDKAPVSTKNFLRYVNEGFYNATAIHRIVAKRVVQGGGFDAVLSKKPTYDPIVNESNNGLSNLQYTIAMARLPAPNSATSQFFFNAFDNSASFDRKDDDNVGYAVFGKIVKGKSVIDKMAKVFAFPADREKYGAYAEVPYKTSILIESATCIKNCAVDW